MPRHPPCALTNLTTTPLPQHRCTTHHPHPREEPPRDRDWCENTWISHCAVLNQQPAPHPMPTPASTRRNRPPQEPRTGAVTPAVPHPRARAPGATTPPDRRAPASAPSGPNSVPPAPHSPQPRFPHHPDPTPTPRISISISRGRTARPGPAVLTSTTTNPTTAFGQRPTHEPPPADDRGGRAPLDPADPAPRGPPEPPHRNPGNTRRDHEPDQPAAP